MKSLLEDLKKYKTQEKFSTKEWKKRHVNPSDKATNERMENFVNNCISKIINIENFNKKEAASIIDKYLNKARKSGFDTEEF